MKNNNARYPFNKIDKTAIIYPGVQIGRNNIIGPYCIIGAPPEWRGQEHISGRVVIGDNNIITGHVTIDSGTEEKTQIGSNCYIMKMVHIGHDAWIMWDVTLSCHAIIGGHVVMGTGSNAGLGSIVHQKQKVPVGVMLGMGCVVTKKTVMEPYKTYVGNPAKLLGDNTKHPQYETYIINQRQTL